MPDDEPEATCQRLSKGLFDLWLMPVQPVFDVVIIGSGYGGSVAARELSGRGLKVAVLERGNEYLPGDFPSNMGDLPSHVRIASQVKGTVSGNHDGLFDLRTGDDVMALVANGLGGGSLINAGVLLAPPTTGLSNATMQNLVSRIEAGGFFSTALAALGGRAAGQNNNISLHLSNQGQRHPQALLKMHAMQSVAHASNCRISSPPLSMAMTDRTNQAGTQLKGCNLCGDCMTGCNVGAKDSLDTNLLRTAHQGGVEIYSGATVHSLRRSDPKKRKHEGKPELEPPGLWALRVTHTNPKLQAKETERLIVFAKKVILAAGTLGSTEILLRSRSEALVFSTRLGEQFSCNGDNIAAITGLPVKTNACADLTKPFDDRKVGPTITQSIEINSQVNGKRFLVQEFAIPAAFGQILSEVVTTSIFMHHLAKPDLSQHKQATKENQHAPDPLGVNKDEIDRTLVVGIIGHDDAAGALFLPDARLGTSSQYLQGTVRIAWPDARHSFWLNESHTCLEELASPFKGAQVLPNPLWRMLPSNLINIIGNQGVAARGPVLTVHPLGGCPMGDSIDDGVVDQHGKVFDACSSSDKWEGSLLVLDGAIIPCSLGVNPSLTITAVAMAAMQHHIHAWGLPSAGTMPVKNEQARSFAAPVEAVEATVATEIEIQERLAGEIHLHRTYSQTDSWILELTLQYQPTKLASLLSSFDRSVEVNAKQSKLRMYRKSTWDLYSLHCLSTSERAKHALVEANVSGSLKFLHREASHPCTRIIRAVLGMVNNIGIRWALKSAWNHLRCRVGLSEKNQSTNWLSMLMTLATHAGEVRRFDYALEIIDEPWLAPHATSNKEAKRLHEILVDWYINQGTIKAEKRLTYGVDSNPWQQVTELRVKAFPGLWSWAKDSVLKIDPQFFAERAVPLLKVTRQANQAQTWIDLLQFGLLVARVAASIHLLTFRAPPLKSRQPQRLPLPVEGVDQFEVIELTVDVVPASFAMTHPSVASAAPVSIRLSRYRCKSSAQHLVGKCPINPLVLIHGYSTSGNTFTHSSLPCSAVSHFCQQEHRDVWVLDLRTSTGMPYATLPWSMEQVALVDIPAALLHVRKVTGQKVDVLAHCIGGVMLSMAMLTRAQEVRNGKVRLGVDTWLNTVQLGALQAFNGSGKLPTDPHPTVRRIVLSQKGPMVCYTPRNVFFASMMQMIRRWLPLEGFQFKLSAEPSRGESLVDRLLSSTYYPGEPSWVEKGWSPWNDRSWMGTRHRMDLLYGQTFNAANMRSDTLMSIDDLFGPMNMDTLAQTMHFARTGVITNQSGRGEFVTINRVADMWHGIPTLVMHAAENRMVDPKTLQLQKDLLEQAGVPVQTYLQPDSGHQDMLLGLRAQQTYSAVGEFLALDTNDKHLETKPVVGGSSLVLRFPWIGPRIRHSTPGLACMSHPNLGSSRLVVCQLTSLSPVQLDCVHHATATLGDIQTGSWAFWKPQLEAPENGFYVPLFVYASGEATEGTPGRLPDISDAFRRNVEQLASSWLVDAASDLVEHALACEDLERAMEGLQAQAPKSIRIALGSCQYPAGIFHADMAQRSLSSMASGTNDAQSSLDLVLFVGDQIYADATAGMLDPTRRDELYEYPYDKALRVPAMRALMRQLPVFSLPDDHEIFDNWEVLSPAVQSERPWQQTLNKRRREEGLTAWHKFMCMQNGLPIGGLPPSADYHFSFKGYPIYLLDTRTCRSARSADTSGPPPSILTLDQQQNLAKWLRQHRQQVKFVATPSVLLPRRTTTAGSTHGGLYSDAWDGYRASLCWLMNLLVDDDIQNTVFLSGDEHHSFQCEIEIEKMGRRIKALSVHSSALYAPYPFANGKPQDFIPAEVFHLGNAQITVKTNWLSQQDGFVVIEHDPVNGLAQPIKVVHVPCSG